jgi:hypothetical protein
MRACLHQPQFIPYLGFFNKVAQCDVYVVLDDVKAVDGDFTNRNRLKSPQGAYWIFIPVKKKDTLIKEMEISYKTPWVSKHLKSLTQYGRALFFNSYYSDIEKIYKKKQLEFVMDIDMEFLKWLFDVLEINIKMVYSSNLNVKSTKTQRLVDICKAIGADVYLSGIGGKNYLDLTLFEKEGIKVEFQNFKHPLYPQRFGGFIENLSIIDLLFNCGEKSLEILRCENK